MHGTGQSMLHFNTKSRIHISPFFALRLYIVQHKSCAWQHMILTRDVRCTYIVACEKLSLTSYRQATQTVPSIYSYV